MQDPVLFWNETALEVHRRDFTVDGRGDAFADGDPAAEQDGPTATSRALAIVHLAIYNAVALTLGRLTPYNGTNVCPSPMPDKMENANAPDCAVAVGAAAVASLGRLFPRQRDWVAQKGTEFLASLQGTPTRRQNAMNLGEDIARRLMNARDADQSKRGGRDATNVVVGGLPGLHRPDPFNRAQGFLGIDWGDVHRFLPPAPAVAHEWDLATYIGDYPGYAAGTFDPTDADYTRWMAEVRDYGGAAGSARSPDQTVAGIFWGYDGAEGLGTPPRLYNQFVRSAIASRNLTTQQLARLFAAVNAGMADAAIIAWRAKYHWDLWRPVIGVREHDAGYGRAHGAGTAGAALAGDPSWVPLGMPRTNQNRFNLTPPFPAYPSGHATFGAVALRTLAHFLAEIDSGSYADVEAAMAAPVDFVSDEYDGTNRDANGGCRPYHKRRFTIAQAIVENALSRVYLGVHWRYDGLGSTTEQLSDVTLDVAAEKHGKVGGVAIGLILADEIVGHFAPAPQPEAKGAGKTGKKT